MASGNGSYMSYSKLVAEFGKQQKHRRAVAIFITDPETGPSALFADQ